MAASALRSLVRQSLPLIATAALLFLSLLTALLVVDRPVKEEKEIARRKEAGQTVAVKLYVPVWLYKGLQANVALSALFLLASPWLGRRRQAQQTFLPAPEMPAFKKWQWAACGVLMAAAAWHHAPRLYHGMWGDEEFNVSRFIVSEYERDEDDSLQEEERPWLVTLWSMRKPTNHLGYSVFARLSHDTFFKPGTGPTDPIFSEALLRAPVYIGGLLIIPALLWALRVWGLSGWWTLLLLLLHPWYLRFGVDGRAYCFLMLSAAVMMGAVGRALQTGLWRWWVLIGFTGFFMLWCNLQGLYLLLASQAMIAAGLISNKLNWNSRWLLLRRWVVAGIVTSLLTIGWLAPCLPQLLEFLAKKEIQGVMDRAFVLDAFTAWFFGQPWHAWSSADHPLVYAMQVSLRSLPWLGWTGIILFVGAILLGIGCLLAKPQRWPLLAFALAAPTVMLLHMLVSGSRPYDWYFSPFVPCLLVLAAAFASPLEKHRAAWPLLALLVISYGWVTHDTLDKFRNHPVENSRGSVASYRQVTNPRHPDIDKEVISGAYVMFTDGYDPAQYRFDNLQGLKELMARADQSSRRFYVNVGNAEFLRSAESTREVMAMLDDTRYFEDQGLFYGLLPFTSRHVYRYHAGSLNATPAAP